MSKVLSHGNQLPLEILETVRTGAQNLIKAVSSFKQRRATFNATYNELAALSNRDLADIGIARSDIAKLAKEQAMKVAAH